MSAKRIKVCIRTRPTATFAENEIGIDCEQKEITIKRAKQSTLQFRYDEVLHNASQEYVYEKSAHDVVESVLNGTNGTVMAFGQTGSGKTFTMLGDTEHYVHRGLAPRAIAQVFSRVSSRIESQFTISCSYMEIYQDKIYDLLENVIAPSEAHTSTRASNTKSDSDYAVLEDKASGKGVYVRGLREIEVNSETEALSLLYAGQQARTTAQHQLNKNSNRSHSIFTLLLRQQSRSGVTAHRIRTSKLSLVDLAGSERLKKTTDASNEKASSVLRKESMYINQSLTFLEQCVLALGNKQQEQSDHVAYRQTKLTSVLKDALGGNCSTVLLACCWGEKLHLEETCSTLRFAARMSKVQNTISFTETADAKMLVKKHEATIRDLKQELLMHNALTERSGVKYDPYSAEESEAISRRIQLFVQAPDEEFDSILGPFQSMRQIKETCFQFKKLLLQAEAKAHQVATKLAAPDCLSAEISINDTNPLTPVSPEIEKEANWVGDPDPRSGFCLGRAADDSVPEAWIAPKSMASSNNLQTKDAPSHLETSDTRPVVQDQSAQRLKEFGKTSAGAGLVEATAIANKHLTEARQHLAEAARTVNTAKAEIDSCKEKLDQQNFNQQNMNSDIVDAEMFVLMQNERKAKAEYRNCHSNWAQAKNDYDTAKSQAQAAKRQLLTALHEWAGPKKSSDDDTLDDQEQFDKMEMDRVVAQDPDALAFFQAKKNRRTITQHTSQMRTRHKRN